MKLQERKSKRFRPGQDGKRVLSVILTAALSLNPFGPVAGFLPGGRVAAAEYLPVPASADCVLLNKVTANQQWDGYRSYSMGEEMTLTGNSGGTLVNYEQGFPEMKYAHVYGGKNGWNAVFENRNFEGNTNDETVTRLGGYIHNYDGSTAYLGNGTSTSAAFDGSDKFMTDWLPGREAKAVISGRGKAHVSHIWFVMADLTAPGEKGWDMEVILEDGAPVLWLTGKEIMRPANDTITSGNLRSLKLRLGLVPRKKPGADPIYVTAEAVKYKDDGSALGFCVKSNDWNGLDGVEYQIINIQDATTESRYDFQLFSGGRLTVKRPIVDLAGNPVCFPSENTKVQKLYLDAQPPAAEVVKLSGTSVNSEAQDAPDQWPDDIDRASLFSKKGDKLQIRVQLSEQVIHPSAEDMAKIYVSWNNLTHLVIDQQDWTMEWKDITSRLTGIEEGYANGVNGDIVSTLIFEPITIPTREDQPDRYQGKRLSAKELYGAEYLLDYSGNAMAGAGEVVDLNAVSPDRQNYLDTRGPLADKGEILTVNKTDQEAYYVVPLHIRDGADGVLAAGVAGLTGRIALTSYAGAPQMSYQYEVSNSAEVPDTLSQRGTVGGEGNEIWSDFKLIGNGDYYLHIKLSDITGKELSDTQGLTLNLQLSDIIGNVSTPKFTVANLALDQVAPELALNAQGVTVSSTGAGNEAVLKVLAQSSDLNGIDRMEYQWTDAGGSAAENGWTVIQAERQEITETVSGENTVSRELVVRAYDVYENVTEKRIAVAADLSRAVGRFSVVGDPQTPSADTDILVSGPASTGTMTADASTRATVVIGSDTYVRIFKGDEQISLLDQGATDWYQVKVSNGKYTEVTQGSPDWSYYGDIRITLTSSLKDLTPQAGSVVDDSADVTLFQDVSMTVAYASRQEGVHSVSFGDVQDSAGNKMGYDRISVGASGTMYSYYNFKKRPMTGTRLLFTLTNAKISGWAQKDVDFDASYAVLVKTDREGNPQEDQEISARASLSQGANQVFSVPAYDKDGNVFASGAYALKVFVKQKAGGEQTFLGTIPLLLDSAGVPNQFGILSYDSSVRYVYGDDKDRYNLATIPNNQTAEEGDVLHTINVPVAKPDGFGMTTAISEGLNGRIPGTIKKIGGHDAYLTEVQNALNGSRASGFTPDIELMLSAQWLAEEEPGKWLGNVLGRASGIKFWNAASSGDPADLPYAKAWYYTTDSSNTRIRFDFNPKWYDAGSDVVSGEELATKTLDDFALTLGSNTICYQLQMENGLVSPVYQFELNLCDQAPELELDYSFGPSVIEKTDTNYDGIAMPKKYAEYVDVSVKDAFSAYGDLTFYHVHYNQFKKIWVRDEIEFGSPIRIYQNGNGSFGFLGTSTDHGSSYNGIEFTTREFICAVDKMGNAVSAYPILTGSDQENTEDDSYYYGITDDSTFFKTTAPALWKSDYTYKVDIESSSDRLDYYTVQMDDRQPERVDLRQPTNYYEKLTNNAGLIYGTGYLIDFVLPYEPDRAEGEEVTHKVKITAYGYAETPASQPAEKTVEYEITAANTKPRVEINEQGSVEIGYVPIKRTTDVQDKEHGIYYGGYYSDYMRTYKNGTYWLTLTDKYGEEYQQELVVSGMPEDPVIDVSTTEPTVGPVVIKVTSEKYLLHTSAHPDYGGASGGCRQQPTVKGAGTKEMEISVPENCNFSIMWGEDEETILSNDMSMYINNIVKNTEISPAIQWCYDESMLEDGNVLRGDRLRAVLVDENGATLIDPQTGSMPYYEFVAGGVTEYTFSGCQTTDGRTVPDVTAVLPVTLLPYETDETVPDTDAPDLAVTGYVERQGKSTQIPGVYLKSRLENAAAIYGYEDAYGAENIFSEMQPFLAKMAWANSYTFRVNAEDRSAVRLFIKKELSDTAPDYETGTSDSIEGVSLTGRTLTVRQNTEFVLYAVDEKGNYSSVPFQVTDLGDLPEPGYVKARTKAGDEVRIYLVKPEIAGISDLQITNDDDNDKVPDAKTEDDMTSAFYGQPYLSVKENGPVVLYYSYSYMGVVTSGSIKLEVNEIDMNPPAVTKETWSANYDPAGERCTNQEISLQMQFDKYLGDIALTDADGNALPSATPGAVTVSWLENRVTVVYENNMPTLRLKAASAVNGKEVVVDLPAVTTIDKTAPTVAVSKVEYSANHGKAVVTITSDEDGILSINGAKGRTFTQTVKENGAYTYTVTDRAGNRGQASVTIEELVTGELKLTLSTAGTNESVIDPEIYEAKIGDTLYAKTNRPVTLYLNGQPVKENMAADTWEAFTVGEDSEGLYPAIKAVDAYGNTALVQLLRIPMRDRKSPVLLLAKRQISASDEKTDEELRTILLANAVYSDETTPKDSLKVTVEFDRTSSESRIPVKYTVRDEAGNEATDTCWLRLSGGEPVVTINGKSIEWDETMAVSAGTADIRIALNGEPYKISWKAGIKTEAQLKTGAQILGRSDGTKEQTFEAALTKPGYYTFCIVTQGRKMYRFVLYVEE